MLTGNYVEDKRLSDIVNKITSPLSPVTGDLLIFDGINWISTTIAKLVEETTFNILKSSSLTLSSSGGKQFNITIEDDGTLVADEIIE